MLLLHMDFIAGGENADSPIQDAFEAMLKMNDNDIHNARRYKTKRLRQLNREELAEVFESKDIHRFRILDEETGTLYDYNTLLEINKQEGDFNDNDSPPDD